MGRSKGIIDIDVGSPGQRGREHRVVGFLPGMKSEIFKQEEFTVGNSMALGPTTVPMLWEHIRRFMEEDGEGAPADEPLLVFERPTSLWQSMGVVSPFGPKFFWWWDTCRDRGFSTAVTSPSSSTCSIRGIWSP